MRKIFVVFVELLFLGLLATTVNAELGPKLGKEQKQSMSVGKEKSITTEKNKEKKKTKGKKKENKIEFAISEGLEKTINNALSQKDNQDFTIEIAASDLILPAVLELEEQEIAPFSDCKLFARPPVLKDIGVNFEVEQGIIDVTTKEYFEQQAKQQGIAEIDYQALKKYVYCGFEYASILGCAVKEIQGLYINFQGWLGFEDMQKIAKKAILKCINTKENKTLRRLAFKTPCYWKESISSLRCGGVVVTFLPFSIKIGSMQVLGEGKFCGLGGTFKLSSAFSLDQSFSLVVKKAKNKNKAYSLAKYVENLESQGKIKKAALLKKKIVEQAKTGHISLSLSPSP